jgi:tetratricopeptide (TPR) repeat protein
MSSLFNQIARSLRFLVILGVILSLLVACGPEPTEAPPTATTAPPELTATPTAKPTATPEPTATPTTEPTPTPEPTAMPEEAELEFVTYEHPSGAFSVDIPEDSEYVEEEDGFAFAVDDSLIMVVFGDVETSLDSTSVEAIAQSILDDTLIEQGLISSYEGLQTESEDDTFLVIFDYTSDALDDGEGGFVLSQLGQTLYALVLLTPDYDSVEEIFLTAFESFEATPVEATAPPAPPTDTPTPPLPPPTPAPVASPAEEHFEKGFDYFQQEKWDEAIAEFQEATRLDAAFSAAYLGLGYSHVRKGEFEQAIAALEKYLQLEPGADNRAQVESDIQQMRAILAQPPSTGPCCQPLQAGKGQIWFENHIGETVQVDVGPNFYEVPPKVGDTPGCLCPQLDPGRYPAVLKTGGAEGRWDIEVVAGQTWTQPLSIAGY